MALDAYMTIKGQKQGTISSEAGTIRSAGSGAKYDKHGDEIAVLAFTSNVINPRDPKSGFTSGARIHQPVVFTKLMDRSSPLLWQALARARRSARSFASSTARTRPAWASRKSFSSTSGKMRSFAKASRIFPDGRFS